MELKHYWRIIKKKIGMIALLIIASCAAVGMYSIQVIEPQYAATTKLIVNEYKDSSQLMPNLEPGSINSTVMLIKTYKEIIKTPRIMKQVVQDYPQLHASHQELLHKVQISSVNETQVMSITVRDDSYERAANMANAVALVFQKSVPELMKVDNISILNEADPEEARGPISPNPVLNVAVAFILSLMAGVAIAFLVDYMNDTARTEEDVENLLGLPVLSSIPRMKDKDVKAQGRRSANAMVGRNNNVPHGS